MMDTLHKLLTATRVSCDMLLRGFEEYKASTISQRMHYIETRQRVVKKLAGAFFDSGHVLQTSGTSSGTSIKYLWGPDFLSALRFFDIIRHDGLSFDKQITFHFTNIRSSVIDGRRLTTPSGHEQLFFKLVYSETDFLKLANRLSSLDGKKFVLWMMPKHIASIIYKYPIFFDSLDPHRFAIHATGDVFPEELKNWLIYRGFDVRDTMRCWNGGASFFCCRYGSLHWLDFMASVQSTDDGSLISTDLYNLSQSFVGYDNGDKVRIINGDDCRCGLVKQHNIWENRNSIAEFDGKLYDFSALTSFLRQSIVSVCQNEDVKIIAVSFGFNTYCVLVTLDTNIEIPEHKMKMIADHFRERSQISHFVLIEHGCTSGEYKPYRFYRLSPDYGKETQQASVSLLKLM